MKKEITIKGQKISYTVKKGSGTKYLRLTISNSGELVVSKPWYLNTLILESFIKKKAEWILDKLAYFKNNPPKYGKKEYLTYKPQAERLVCQKIDRFNQHYRFQFSQISIRNQRTRWGSCSSRGNLNFNYKIVFLPTKMIDYIVVHELCHLKEMNHSEKFWNLVSQTIPDYKAIRKDLQKKGIELR